ncbi:MAG: c-type cytochrome [Aridibacter sp.]
MKFVKLVLILAAIALFVIACTQTEKIENTAVNNANTTANATTEASATQDELALGGKLYKDNCAKCHKEDGTGGKVEIEGKTLDADNLISDKMKKMPDEKYIKYITNGIPDEGMPAFKDVLSEDEIKAVIKYIREELQK